MSNDVKSSPYVPSTCVQNGMLYLQFKHIISSRQIYVAIDNPLLVLTVSCLTTSSYIWHSLHTANDITHAEDLQRNCCLCFSHFYTFQDAIQVT
jgi:hypothetical protein